MMPHISENETVIKRILPYLERRGYSIADDLTFEEPAKTAASGRVGFVDILVKCGKPSPLFPIEAKRDGTKITQKHRDQAIAYGRALKCLFVAITNGKNFELLNTKTKAPLSINGSALDRLPTRDDLIKRVIPQLKAKPEIDTLVMPSDKALPFRPGLPLSKLNHLIKQSHNTIRKIEKNEEHAFSDFSKILFLKLLEEKWDAEDTKPPYSYQFHRLAETPKGSADQVRTAVESMIGTIQKSTKFGDVLADPIRLKKDNTYLAIIRSLSAVSFSDCELDTKGAAFEYFVRATLKGKKLGQYFTPRPLVRLMLHLGRYEQIVKSLMAGQPFKVLDPACGTGGFLVLAMNLSIAEVESQREANAIHKTLAEKVISALKSQTFFGIDAHEGVASSAKMNMIIAGDGHNNIRCADSLAESKLVPNYKNEDGETVSDGKAHLILTNPPFGTSEGESLTAEDLGSYDVPSVKGQSLFIQKMISSALPSSRIVTVIDDGVLNTASHRELRSHILKTCRIEYVLSLPDETFKPNKITVKSSVLVLQRRSIDDENLEDDYPIGFVKLSSLGYEGSGDEVRGFDLSRLIREVSAIDATKLFKDKLKTGYEWQGFRLNSSAIVADTTRRFDLKYWNPYLRGAVVSASKQTGAKTIKDLNTVTTRRGRSPSSSDYVSEKDGYALVVKAGSSISKAGELVLGGDFIEKPLYEDFEADGLSLKDGDVLLASTGDGTLGKCCVYRNYDSEGALLPAIADGHITVIRVDQSVMHPEFLCDFLRKGFGARQVERLYTGSTGLIEITPEDVDRIIAPPPPSIETQKALSTSLRDGERHAVSEIAAIYDKLKEKERDFLKTTLPEGVTE